MIVYIGLGYDKKSIYLITKTMNRSFFRCIILLTLSACLTPRYNPDLLRIESYIQSDPGRALNELVTMSDIPTKEADKGLYSLLYSMALDKNYIDIKSDSILAPAVSYYRHHTDSDRSFLTYYYLGRIRENADSSDDALFAFLRAEEMLGPSVPIEYFVRLYAAKKRIYIKQLALDKALLEAQKAQAWSSSLANYTFYVNASLDVISLLNLNNNPDESSKELDSLTVWMSQRDLQIPSYYYKMMLYRMILHHYEGVDSLIRCRSLYSEACQREGAKQDSILLADIFVKLQEYDNAKELMDQIHLRPGSSLNDSINYYSTVTSVYKGLRDFDNYVSSVQESRRLVETKSMNIFNNDVRFLEERNNNTIEMAKKQRKNTILIVIACLLCAITATVIILTEINHKKLQRDLKEAQGEYSFIKEAFSSAQESPTEIKDQLHNRLVALAPYFQSTPARPLGRSELARLKKDNREMLRTIGLIYAFSFPEFVSKLVRCKLNAEEIGLCSLYASGFVTKELTDIIEKGSIYRINSSIRSKLGDAVGGRTLPAWLRELFKSSSE